MNINKKKYKLKRIAIIVIILLVAIGFIPATKSFNLQGQEEYKWVSVGNKYTHENVILGEYSNYIQKNYLYIQQNPFMLMNFLNSLISQHVSTLIFTNEAEKLHLGLSQDVIFKLASDIPAFQNEKQQFDRTKFAQQIANLYGSEDVFLNDASNNMMKDQLLEAIYPNVSQPEYVGYLDYLAISQKRDIKYIEIDPSSIKIDSKPTDDQLTKIKDKNAQMFNIPETRDVTVFKADLKKITNNIKATKDEIHQYYDENTNNYMNPETRDVSQITFSSEDLAKKEYDRIKSLKISDIAKDKNSKLVNIGSISKKDFPDNVSNTIFSADDGSITAPVKSTLGWHIFIINKIIAPEPKSFNSVKKEVEMEVTERKKQEAIEEFKNKFANLISHKTDSDKIAKILNLTVSNNTNLVAPKSTYDENITKEIFAASEHNTPVLTEDSVGNLFAVQINKINAAHSQTIAEAKSKLTQMWIQEQKDEKANKLANDLIEKITTGSHIDSLKYKVNNLSLTILDQNNNISETGIATIFAAPLSQAVQGGFKNNKIFVAVVTKISNKKVNILNKNGTKNQEILNFISYSNRSYSQEFLQVLSKSLDKKYKIQVNDKAILNKLAPNDNNSQEKN